MTEHDWAPIAPPEDWIWNGRRWVSRAEWMIARRIKRRADRARAYLALPWYKRLFIPDPRKED